MSGFELLKRLKELGYIKEEEDPYWWKNSGTFEVVVGAILTQNSRWERVQVGLERLRSFLGGTITLEGVASMDQRSLEELIKPAGFYRTKSHRIITLSRRIGEEYGNFQLFRSKVSRRWLLEQKGIGPETADTILNYACYKEFLVVDSYTARLLSFFGYQFESYDELQSFLGDSLIENLPQIYQLYGKPLPLAQIYGRFHGKIVEFCKEFCRGKGAKERVLKALLRGE
ncbi:MAG: 3-methyladenine DNA glycosylase [Epsilonproteobacteria bacterium]|nr:3-methyladenine DNA glycosylase [Campylobacterota bacterium]NPA56746.1 3-methyladenine DNA glycosylase [Campylobacterota bacterium]